MKKNNAEENYKDKFFNIIKETNITNETDTQEKIFRIYNKIAHQVNIIAALNTFPFSTSQEELKLKKYIENINDLMQIDFKEELIQYPSKELWIYRMHFNNLISKIIHLDNNTKNIIKDTYTEILCDKFIKYTETNDTLLKNQFIEEISKIDARTILEKISSETFEGYTIIEKINEGGMGIVYKAEKQDSFPKNKKEIVAIKTIKGELTNEILNTFQKEIQILEKLNHPNIVKILKEDAEKLRTKKQIYFVMEFIDGKDLRKILQIQNLSIQEKYLIISQIMSGLDYLHKMGYLHRDIKPENIIIKNSNNETTAKIIDLGIAKEGAKINSQKSTIHMLKQSSNNHGTKSYSSPEASGINGNNVLTHKTDIWAIGIILYELFYGVHPYYSNNDSDSLIEERLHNLKKLRKKIKHYTLNANIDLHKRTKKKLWKKIFSPIFQYINNREISITEIQNHLEEILTKEIVLAKKENNHILSKVLSFVKNIPYTQKKEVPIAKNTTQETSTNQHIIEENSCKPDSKTPPIEENNTNTIHSSENKIVEGDHKVIIPTEYAYQEDYSDDQDDIKTEEVFPFPEESHPFSQHKSISDLAIEDNETEIRHIHINTSSEKEYIFLKESTEKEKISRFFKIFNISTNTYSSLEKNNFYLTNDEILCIQLPDLIHTKENETIAKFKKTKKDIVNSQNVYSIHSILYPTNDHVLSSIQPTNINIFEDYFLELIENNKQNINGIILKQPTSLVRNISVWFEYFKNITHIKIQNINLTNEENLKNYLFPIFLRQTQNTNIDINKIFSTDYKLEQNSTHENLKNINHIDLRGNNISEQTLTQIQTFQAHSTHKNIQIFTDKRVKVPQIMGQLFTILPTNDMSSKQCIQTPKGYAEPVSKESKTVPIYKNKGLIYIYENTSTENTIDKQIHTTQFIADLTALEEISKNIQSISAIGLQITRNNISTLLNYKYCQYFEIIKSDISYTNTSRFFNNIFFPHLIQTRHSQNKESSIVEKFLTEEKKYQNMRNKIQKTRNNSFFIINAPELKINYELIKFLVSISLENPIHFKHVEKIELKSTEISYKVKEAFKTHTNLKINIYDFLLFIAPMCNVKITRPKSHFSSIEIIL